MKLVLTVWDGRISPVFDVCRELLLLDIESGQIVARTTLAVAQSNALFKIEQLVDLGAETLICGAISEPLHGALSGRGVQVLGFVAGEIDEVVRAFIAGELPGPDFAMPGCQGRQRRFRGGRGQGRQQGQGQGRRAKSE